LIGGGITVGMTGLKLIAFLTPCEFDDKVANCLSPFANLANFCILIWGSVVIFGKKAFDNFLLLFGVPNSAKKYTPYLYLDILHC
jgi:hypothetical protein